MLHSAPQIQINYLLGSYIIYRGTFVSYNVISAIINIREFIKLLVLICYINGFTTERIVHTEV